MNLVDAGNRDLAGNDSKGELGFYNRHDEADTSSDAKEETEKKIPPSVYDACFCGGLVEKEKEKWQQKRGIGRRVLEKKMG